MSVSYGGYTASGKECVVCTRPVPVFVLAPQSQLLWNSFTFGQGHPCQVDVTLAVLANRLTNHFQDLTRNTTLNDFCSNCCLNKLDLRENLSCTELMRFSRLLNELVVSISGTIEKIQSFFIPTGIQSSSQNERDMEEKRQQGRIDSHADYNSSCTTDTTTIPSSPPRNEFFHDDDESLKNVTPECPTSPEVETSLEDISLTLKKSKEKSRCRKKKLKTGARGLAKGVQKLDEFSCNICNKVLSAQIHLDSHMLLHSNEKPFECTICQKKFRHNPALFLHMRVHQGIKPYKCDVCERPFATKWKMDQHKKTHTKEKPILCEFCPKQWLNVEYLRGHMRFAHPETFGDKYAPEKLQKCALCDKVFLYTHLLRRHELSRHNIEERPYQCELCGKRFPDKSHMERHVREVHFGKPRISQTRIKTLQCIECEKMFWIPSTLKSHMIVHENARLVKCDICSANVPKKLIKAHLNHHENPGVRLRSRKKVTRQRLSRMKDKPTIKEENSCSNLSFLAIPKLEKEVKICLTRLNSENIEGSDDVMQGIKQETEW